MKLRACYMHCLYQNSKGKKKAWIQQTIIKLGGLFLKNAFLNISRRNYYKLKNKYDCTPSKQRKREKREMANLKRDYTSRQKQAQNKYAKGFSFHAFSLPSSFCALRSARRRLSGLPDPRPERHSHLVKQLY